MECVTNWSFKAKAKTEVPTSYVVICVTLLSCVWDLCFSPDGKKIIAGVGNHVLVYRSECGTLLRSLKGHKDTSLCVNYSSEGSYFASGGADNTVIVWRSVNYEGVIKYTYANRRSAAKPGLDIMEALGVFPSTLKLYFWLVVQRMTLDGGELISIERGDGIAILDLEWTYLNLEKTEIFGVCDSSERLSLYQLTGKQLLQTCGSLTSKLALTQKSVKGPVGTKCGKDRYLGFIPMCMNWIGDSSEYLAICGQNQKINLYSYEGCQIGHLTEEKSWILSCKKHPQEKQLVIGCQDGTIRSMQYFTPIVHSFYKDRYAFRDIITDVIIQHLVTEQKARIKCRDVVKKIAIFKNRLAIQLSDRVLIYDSAADDPFDMHYHIKEKVMLKFNCQVLLVASQHIIYCQDCKITCVNFQGQMEHFWCLDSSAQCIQQNGGPDGNESLTIGTTNGQVFKLNLNSAFPILLTKIDTKVSFIDLSSDRDKIAVIDCNNTLTVHSLQTKEILLREANITSAAWNQVINDLLCYTSKDTLHIVTVDYTCHQQPIEGVVVGFNGSSVYCLSSQFVRRIEVQLAQAMYYYLDAGRLKEAYQMARLGVSETDWRKLGNAALLNMELQVSDTSARRCLIARSVFVYLGDYFYLTYIQQLEERQRHGSVQPPDSLMTSTEKLLIEAELACFQGDYKEAAKTFKKANHVERVVGLYTDLRRFTEAKEIMISASGDAESKNGECDFYSEEATRGLLAKHAEWARATKDHRTAATMFIEAGNYGAAIELAAEHGWVDVLLELSRKVDKGDRIHLDLCAKHLAKLGECAFAADCYARIGDVESQLDILIRAAKWDESLSLVQGNPEYTRKVYLPYAQWLAENDSFEEAQAAFARAGLANETVRFLEELASCAVSEFRFDDASWYYWKLSKQCAEVAKGSQGETFIIPRIFFAWTGINHQHTKREYLRRFKDCAKRADVYYVYNNIYRYMKDPFATHVPEAYFNMARYLLQRLGKDDFDGISKKRRFVLFTLAKHSKNLGAFKLARYAFDRLQTFHIKQPLRRLIELQSLAIKNTPVQDSEDIIVVCFRCSATNSTLQSDGRCTNCKAPFVYSFLYFGRFDELNLRVRTQPIEFFSASDILPLVEFVPDPELTAEEVIDCIRSDPITQHSAESESSPGNINRLTPDFDPFAEKLSSFNISSTEYQPVVLDATTLKAIPSAEIIILEADYPLRKRFFKNVLPEVGVTWCRSCNKIFQKEDYQLIYLQRHQCPFCKFFMED
ncbi:unnamed protein product [Mesocestoides corti]|uniref:Intraflagellar transport protein 122 homolog n=1 Tax=Mesocestoides corti TaxID=53468 RepID=A0A158QSW8_MESCO|nr:unnamed protein product [Mesocestoides corti]